MASIEYNAFFFFVFFTLFILEGGACNYALFKKKNIKSEKEGGNCLMKGDGGKKLLLVGIACVIAYAEFGAMGVLIVGVVLMML